MAVVWVGGQIMKIEGEVDAGIDTDNEEEDAVAVGCGLIECVKRCVVMISSGREAEEERREFCLDTISPVSIHAYQSVA